MSKLNIDRAAIPVLGEADAVVVGGSLAGLACALELAGAGRSVWLVEPRTYMGRELTATLRPWLELPEDGTLPALIAHVLVGAGRPLAPRPSEFRLDIEADRNRCCGATSGRHKGG